MTTDFNSNIANLSATQFLFGDWNGSQLDQEEWFQNIRKAISLKILPWANRERKVKTLVHFAIQKSLWAEGERFRIELRIVMNVVDRNAHHLAFFHCKFAKVHIVQCHSEQSIQGQMSSIVLPGENKLLSIHLHSSKEKSDACRNNFFGAQFSIDLAVFDIVGVYRPFSFGCQ